MGLISNIKAALFPPEQDPDSPPAWVGRLKDARYTSLSGASFVFLYLDLSAYLQLKTSVFGNVDGDGVYIQQNGIGGMRFPMLMVFNGSDNDTEAKEALAALIEPGVSTLSHPVFGDVQVCTTGEIQQINAFVTAANQTSLVVELMETTGLLIGNIPAFDSALDTYLDNAAQSFADTVNTIDVPEEVSLATKVKESIGEVKKVMDRLSNGVAATQAALDDTFDSINFAIDTLVKDPLMLARQIQRLALTPARELGLIKSKLKAYGDLASDIFGRSQKQDTVTYDNTGRNNFAVDALVLGSLIAGLSNIGENSTKDVPSGDTSGPPSRKELVAIYEKVQTSTEEYIEWADEQSSTLGITNNSSDWQDLNDASSISVSTIIDAIQNAQTEVKITTEYERATAAWCYEFYASIKNNVLWKFQRDNGFGGDELVTIKEGRELVYYV